MSKSINLMLLYENNTEVEAIFDPKIGFRIQIGTESECFKCEAGGNFTTKICTSIVGKFGNAINSDT